MCVSDVQAGTGREQVCLEVDHYRDRRLSRKQRIIGSHSFQQAFNSGRSYVGSFMVMWLRSGADACLRLGVVSSKRTFRRAVDRGRAKRLLREAYRLNRYRFGGSFDVVLVARAKIGAVMVQAVEKDLLILASKAGILKEKL